MSLNKVILIGRLGRDPEIRYMPNGEAVANFSVATSESWTDRNSGQRQERTEWHNITMYRRLAALNRVSIPIKIMWNALHTILFAAK